MRHFDPKKQKQSEQQYLKKIKKGLIKLDKIEKKLRGLDELLEVSIKEVKKVLNKT